MKTKLIKGAIGLLSLSAIVVPAAVIIPQMNQSHTITNIDSNKLNTRTIIEENKNMETAGIQTNPQLAITNSVVDYTTPIIWSAIGAVSTISILIASLIVANKITKNKLVA